MEAKTTIEKIFQGNKINVPKYQRAYSWESPKKDFNRATQTDVFLQDLEDYSKSNTDASYYFGHFLFEHTTGNKFNVIDGQQRLTTIVIFLSALFKELKKRRELQDEEFIVEENILKRRTIVHFSTVDYDDVFFKDYVINQSRESSDNLETESSKRIAKAFNYFQAELNKKSDQELVQLLKATKDATSTTHEVEDEAEAIQMFIFQNNRGKKPTNLEIIKARFMYHAHLNGGEAADDLINEIKQRFEGIYRAISSIEYKMSEDEVLAYSLRVYFNSLHETGSLEKIDKELSKDKSLEFVGNFTQELDFNFRSLSKFYGSDEKDFYEVHSLVVLGGLGLAMPFILKAYKLGIEKDQFLKLCKALESIILRNRLIGTRADLAARLNGVFQNFNSQNQSVDPILEKIEYIKNPTDWWWAYWNNDRFEESISGGIHFSIARFLIWKYDNSLNLAGQKGYSKRRYDDIKKPELEHIAPQTEPKENPHGYGEYNEEFKNKYLNCLGNYALISKSHNCTVSNAPFWKKHKSYSYLPHQEEIKKMAPEKGPWNNHVISARNTKIKNFILDNF